MGSRTEPYVCEHGRTLDWGGHGGDDEAETCEECEAALEPLPKSLRLQVFYLPGDRHALIIDQAAALTEGEKEQIRTELERIRDQLGCACVLMFDRTVEVL